MAYQRFSIFVADDDEDDCLLIKSAFNDVHPECELAFFGDGEYLLSHLTTLSEHELPTLILLDLNMPSVTGYEVLRQMRNNELLRYVPVLVLTGLGQEIAVKQCYQLGANTFMHKPNNFVQLVKLLSTTCDYWLNTVKVPGNVEYSLY